MELGVVDEVLGQLGESLILFDIIYLTQRILMTPSHHHPQTTLQPNIRQFGLILQQNTNLLYNIQWDLLLNLLIDCKSIS